MRPQKPFRISALALALAAILVACAVAGRNPWHNWPPLPPVRASADISQVAHPPAVVMATLHHDCYNCHSDRPELPWYGYVWPASSQIQDDIHRASARLNFSEWDQLSPEMARIRSLQACMMVSGNKMPLWYYKPMHPGSTVTAQQATVLCDWARGLPAPLTERQGTSSGQ